MVKLVCPPPLLEGGVYSFTRLVYRNDEVVFLFICTITGVTLLWSPLQEECDDLHQKMKDGILKKPTVVSFLDI